MAAIACVWKSSLANRCATAAGRAARNAPTAWRGFPAPPSRVQATLCCAKPAKSCDGGPMLLNKKHGERKACDGCLRVRVEIQPGESLCNGCRQSDSRSEEHTSELQSP